MPIREIFKLVYKIGMILATLGLGIGAVAAWYYATPGNGLLLVSGILALLTLIVGPSISKLEDQDRQAETWRGIVQSVPQHIKFAVRHAEPEVHRVDAAGLEDAKRMAAEGASIDDICRSIDPQHDRHDPARREAFRNIVRTMIEQG